MRIISTSKESDVQGPSEYWLVLLEILECDKYGQCGDDDPVSHGRRIRSERRGAHGPREYPLDASVKCGGDYEVAMSATQHRTTPDHGIDQVYKPHG